MTAEPGKWAEPYLSGVHFGLSQADTINRELITCGADPAHTNTCAGAVPPLLNGEPVSMDSTDPFIQAWIMRTYADDIYGSPEAAWQWKLAHGTY
jgi:hypothetical protein